MSIRAKTFAAAIVVVAVIASGLLSACTRVPRASSAGSDASASCSALLANVIQRARTGDTAGLINAELDALSRNCSVEYDIATDYFSTSGSARQFGPDTCESWREYDIRPEAIELLREDGLCTDGAGAPAESSWPEGGLGWNEARDLAGTSQRVCGPLASVRGTDDGVFVNIGRDYPSPDRFTFVIWGDWWLDPLPSDAVICAVGEIYLYGGVAQVELGSPGELEIWQ